jgi:ABC-type glycerol-3-phosphate transport system permease component
MIKIAIFVMVTVILLPFVVAVFKSIKNNDGSDDSWYN